MTEATLLGAFFLITLGILVIPGPDVLYVTARSLGQGRRAGLLSVVGIGAGVLVHTVLAAFGLSQLFLHVPAAYEVVRYAGVAYLLYLAWRIVRDRSEHALDRAETRTPAHKLIGEAFLTNLLNPKAALFFVAFLPQFTTAEGDALFVQMLTLGLIVVAMSVLVNLAYALLAARARVLMRSSPRVEIAQKWTSAGLLGVIAIIAMRVKP